MLIIKMIVFQTQDQNMHSVSQLPLFWNRLATTTLQNYMTFILDQTLFTMICNHPRVQPCNNFSLISSITTSISNHDIQPSLYGLAIFASKVMDIISHALSVFLVKHEIKMISIVQESIQGKASILILDAIASPLQACLSFHMSSLHYDAQGQSDA